MLPCVVDILCRLLLASLLGGQTTQRNGGCLEQASAQNATTGSVDSSLPRRPHMCRLARRNASVPSVPNYILIARARAYGHKDNSRRLFRRLSAGCLETTRQRRTVRCGPRSDSAGGRSNKSRPLCLAYEVAVVASPLRVPQTGHRMRREFDAW